MAKKKDLVEDVKVMESNLKVKLTELKSLQHQVGIALEYEEELEVRRTRAANNTKELREKFFVKSGEVTNLLHEMKSAFDIWTGNFYRDFL